MWTSLGVNLITACTKVVFVGNSYALELHVGSHGQYFAAMASTSAHDVIYTFLATIAVWVVKYHGEITNTKQRVHTPCEDYCNKIGPKTKI